MNSRVRRASAAGDFSTIRLVIATLLAMPAWLLFLAGMAHWVETSISTSTREPEDPLPTQLVELDPPPLAAPTAPARAAPAAPITPAAAGSAHAARSRLPGEPPPLRTPLKQPAQRALAVQSAAHDAPAPSAPESAQEKNAGAASAARASTGEASARNTSPADSAAHSIAQPLPELPDDLREQSYEAVALARFLIHIDGSVGVELIKPTSVPRLNQILLETLRTWRFFPAMQGGHPVESIREIRVRFNVR